MKTDDWRYVAAAGLADPDAGTPMDCAVPFQIGNNTKMMTAVVLLKLFDERQLGLDDTLSKHLTEIAARLSNGDAITVRHLARHTSRVFSYTDNAPDGTPGLMEGDTTESVSNENTVAAPKRTSPVQVMAGTLSKKPLMKTQGAI